MGTPRSAVIGLNVTKEIDRETLLPVLRRAWEGPFTTRSDFARAHTDQIAIASCLGLITVRQNPDTWGRVWRITAAGLRILETSQ